MHVRPFAALRPVPEAAPRIAALPYDVVSADEARQVVADEPLSFLAVDLPETAFEPGHDPYAADVYEKGAELFQDYGDQGLLVQDPTPAFYVYELSNDQGAMTGLVCLVDVADYERGLVKRHENTRRAKEDDRVRHIGALAAQTGPVFLAYRDETPEGDFLREATELSRMLGAPVYDFRDRWGVRNQLWAVSDPEAMGELEWRAASLPCAYIADGHHRAASAARVAAERGGEATGLMAVLFPAGELTVLPYNRVVADCNGLSPEGLLRAIQGAGFVVAPAAAPVQPDAPGVFGLFTDGRWFTVAVGPELAAEVAKLPPAEQLDVAVLQNRVLGPILGIGDPREDPRIDFMGGNRGLDELAASAGEDGIAVSCFPTSAAQLMAVADDGALMPPKSTWFEPKLRSGLLFHRI